MQLLLLILCLTLPAAFLRVPLFYGVFGILLPAPIVARLFYVGIHHHLISYLLSFCFLFLVLAILAGVRRPRLDEVVSEGVPIVLFSLSFIGLYWLALRWPDFFAMGERLRDYAVLSALLKDPYLPQEPWMAGEGVSYYLQWYRFGHLLSNVLHLKTWEAYHVLSAFPLALLFATLSLLLQRLASFSTLAAVVSSSLICFGSNIQGVINFMAKSGDWWGPSRVVKGAINEFPVWSFLLGDVHPHYLNLPLPLFLLGVIPLIALSERVRCEKLLYFGALLIVAPFWLYNANAWDVPFWLGTAMLIVPAIVAARWVSGERGTLPTLRVAATVLVSIWLITSLILSSRNIQMDPGHAALVKRPIEVTSMMELALHWGAPITIIGISTLLLSPSLLLPGALLGTALSTFADPALPLLVVLLTLIVSRLTFQVVGQTELSPQALFFEGCGIAALGLITLPEIVFLNDSYGGESERMNTIFKAYSYAWPLLHLYAFWLLARAWKERDLARFLIVPIPLAYAVSLVFFCGFAFHVAQKLRPTTGRGLAEAEGLKGYDVRYPGAAAAIRALRSAPPGVVLEAQGDAYSDATHVATLAEQSSYLGWVNHLQLLLPSSAQPRIAHRVEMSGKIYREPNCESKRQMLKQEGISYLVFGPLEAEKFGAESIENFRCLTPLLHDGLYTILEP